MHTKTAGIDLLAWKNRLEKELKNQTLNDLQWQASEYFQMEPLYTAENIEDLEYLKAFHEKWTQLQPAQKPTIVAPVSALIKSKKEDIKTAETYHFQSWADETDLFQTETQLPVSTRLWEKSLSHVNSQTEFDPAMDALVLGKITEGFHLNQKPEPATLHIHAADVHQAGGSAVQELAVALLVASHYQQNSTDMDWASTCVIHLAAGPQFWLEMCKFRAMRLLWFNFCKSNNLDNQIGQIRGVSSKVFWSHTDSDINLLRHTIESMAMILGGANQVQIQPHTMESAAGLDATRQAVNIIHLAIEESHMETYRDPAAGSFSADMLTHQLAKAAWDQFVAWNEIGFEELISRNILQLAIKEQSDILQKSFAAEKITMVGVNIYPSEFSKVSSPFPEMPKSESSAFMPLRPVFLNA